MDIQTAAAKQKDQNEARKKIPVKVIEPARTWGALPAINLIRFSLGIAFAASV